MRRIINNTITFVWLFELYLKLFITLFLNLMICLVSEVDKALRQKWKFLSAKKIKK